MIIVLGDLLADYSLRLPDLHIRPQDLHPVTYIELGPGGATNGAITAARLGLSVACLGEVGDDLFGRIVRDSLATEGIDTTGIRVTTGARTPVANVLVDGRGEPAYLGYPGNLQLSELPTAWRLLIAEAEALYCDGWVEHEGAASMILQAFRVAKEAAVPAFFDPGPGNPQIDNTWHLEATALATVVLATEEEAVRLTGHSDPLEAVRALFASGPELVIVKRGMAGCLLLNDQGLEIAAGYPVKALDTTGAGDSFAGAVIYGYLRGLAPPALGTLANATGAAKVQKLGTGHNMPTPGEIRAVLARSGKDSGDNFGLPD